MKSPILFLLMGGLVVVFSGTVAAQENDWIIIRSSGDSLVNCRLDSLTGMTLWYHQRDTSKSLALDAVSMLSLPGSSHGAVGAAIGLLAGGIMGYLLAPEPTVEQHSTEIFILWEGEEAYDSRPAATFFGAGAGGLIGLIVGSNIGSEKVYALDGRDERAKTELVGGILRGDR